MRIFGIDLLNNLFFNKRNQNKSHRRKNLLTDFCLFFIDFAIIFLLLII